MSKQHPLATPALASPTPAVDPGEVGTTPPLAPVQRRVALALQVDQQRCLSCGGCISVCPRMVVPISNFNSLAADTLCQGCGLCVKVCPVEALSQQPVFISEPLRVPGSREQRRSTRIELPPSRETQ